MTDRWHGRGACLAVWSWLLLDAAAAPLSLKLSPLPLFSVDGLVVAASAVAAAVAVALSPLAPRVSIVVLLVICLMLGMAGGRHGHGHEIL